MDKLSAQWSSPALAGMASVLVWTQRWGMLAAAGAMAILAQPADARPAKAKPAGSRPIVDRVPMPAGYGAYSDARTGAVLNVPINKSQTLRVDRPLAKAVVGSADIADIVPISPTAIYVLGKSIGSTNVTLIDRNGGVIAVIDVVVSPDSQGLKRKLAELMPAEAVNVSTSNDALVLEGKVSSAAAADRIMVLAETFAPKKSLNMLSIGSPQQVLLEVRFAEMSRATVKQLGISNVSFLNGTGAGAILSPGTGSNTAGFTGGFNFPGGLRFRLDALEQRGMVRTLAQPNLMTLSGETSNFLAGGEFPVPSSVSNNGQVSIEFKQFGVSLAFTPTVLQDGLINLLVAPEVSSLDSSAGISLNGTTIPGLKVRRAKTVVELRDGESLAIAGLIQSDFADTVNAVPLLGKIPIIGMLFRSTSFKKNETELVIIVTPRIVRPVSPGSLASPTDRVLIPNDADLFINGTISQDLPQTKVMPLTGTNPTRPGGVAGDFGHIVR